MNLFKSQEPEYLSGPPHSFRECGAKKLLRKKKNESWAMRRLVSIRGLTSPTLEVGGNLSCKIVQSGSFGSASAGILPAAVGILPTATHAARTKVLENGCHRGVEEKHRDSPG